MDEFKASNGAYVGTCPWAYGGIWRPETEHVNDFGMVWAGDPPHESPGWYGRSFQRPCGETDKMQV
jgi:mannan endo-1,4-beta-mannosidase